MSESEFEFTKEIPKRTSENYGYVDPERLRLAVACKSHPGEWLKVPTTFYSHLRRGGTDFASVVKAGKSPAFLPKGAFNARVRNGIVYMMYKGTPEE